MSLSGSRPLAGAAPCPVHVEVRPAAPGAPQRLPLLMLHGAFHTGAAYLATPDGREGWADWFARRGHEVFVADWPGHGRSQAPMPLETLGTRDIALALAQVLERSGPAIVLAHSAAGPMAWWMAEQHPEWVAAIVGIAPGSPANILPVLPLDPHAIAALSNDSQAGCPVYSAPHQPLVVDQAFIETFWASAPRFPKQALQAYARTIVAESPRVLNERFNIGGSGLRLAAVDQVRQRPILIVTGEHDPRHPRATDAQLAAYLHAEHLWLPDAGQSGNGHMLMIEDNSLAIAELIGQWLARQGL